MDLLWVDREEVAAVVREACARLRLRELVRASLERERRRERQEFDEHYAGGRRAMDEAVKIAREVLLAHRGAQPHSDSAGVLTALDHLDRLAPAGSFRR
jgi:hypothetical protein